MSQHYPSTRSSTISSQDSSETMKKTPSPRRQTTRSLSHLNKDSTTTTSNSINEQCIQVIKPVAVRPPSSDSTQTPYNLRSRTKLKGSHSQSSPSQQPPSTQQQQQQPNSEVIPSFTEKLSLETPSLNQSKPVPPLTRAAAASAGLKIDSVLSDDSNRAHQKINTRSATTRKRKASEDDHRPYLDLLKMKQTKSTYSFDGNSPKKMTKRLDHECFPADDEDSGCDYDSPAHSPVDFTDVPPGHVFHYEESNMSYDSGFSTGSRGESNDPLRLSQSQTLPLTSSSTTVPSSSSMSACHNSGVATRSSTINLNKYPAAIDLDVNAIEGDLGF